MGDLGQEAHRHLHGTQISGTLVVAVVLGQVRRRQSVHVAVSQARLVGQQDSAALADRTNVAN